MSIIPDNFNFTVKFLISISKITLHNYYMLPKKRSGGGGDSMTFQNILCTCKFKKNVCWEKRGSLLPHLCYVSAKSEMLDTLKVYLHYTLYTFRKTGPCIMYLFHNHYSSAKMCTCTSRRSHSVYSHGLKMHIKTWYGWKMINW